MEICKYDDCTGCFACYNICPVNCISIEPDKYGELHPFIDEKKCIGCKNCIRVCPGNKKDINLLEPIKCYAAYRLDKQQRLNSASGGIGTVLSEAVIDNDGIVIGVKFDKEIIPRHTIATTLNEIEDFKGSKYVQSRIDDIYKKIKFYLNKNRKVLFIGTPCQISGLKMYLNNIEYENLMTCDLICHGVSSYKYLQENLKNNIASKISKISFRSNDPKANFRFRVFFENKIIYNKRWFMNNYFLAFLSGISLRDSCYKCKYACSKRISDITIGDFFGLGKNEVFTGNPDNASVVLINTLKGQELFDKIKDKIFFQQRNYIEAIKGGISLRKPFPMHKKRNKFKILYLKVGFDKSIDKLMIWDKMKYFYILIVRYLKRRLFFGNKR